MASPNSSSQSIVLDAVVDFLNSVPPFQFLPEPELRSLAGHLSIEYFPKDTVILSAGEETADCLYIVKKGAVKLSIATDGGLEVMIDIRSEGELFGLLSTMGGDITRLDVTSIEDTLCYSMPGAQVRTVIMGHPEVAGFLFRTSVTRYIDRSLMEIRERARLLSDGERLLYSLSVADVAKRQALMCSEDTSIRNAAQQMTSAHSTSIFVVNSTGRAIGIVTDNDLTEKVVARAAPLDAPVTTIMSSPVLSVESGDRVFHAMLQMLNRNIHHLLVTREGLPDSTITDHDVLLLQGKSPLTLMRHMGEQHTLEDLVAAQGRTAELIPLLMREGAKASHITRVVAELNDRVLAKILELGEKELGAPPVHYCWVTFGSEGRQEQTFKTDQDNGLIYGNVPDEHSDAADAYFADLALFVRSALERCGYPRCPGDFMATNPRWRQPLGIWKRNFEKWITDPEQLTVENALILYDMRGVAGDLSLVTDLWKQNRELVKGSAIFKSIFAFVTINHKPPLGFFRTFVVERSGEHKDEFDLKLHGTGPIVNAARLWCLDAGIEQTNTIDRLAALQSAGYCDPKLLTDLREAMEFLTLLRLERQLEQAKAGVPISNYVNPGSLSQLQKALLKEAFEAIARAQTLIKQEFETWVWAHLR